MSLGLKRGTVQLEPHDKQWDEAAIQTTVSYTHLGRLAESRGEVMEAVEKLSQIAHDNVDSTQQTYTETQEVLDTFKQVYDSAGQLKKIADELAQSMQYFKIQ